jgi:uncharacterized protein (TIGR02145 family)
MMAFILFNLTHCKKDDNVLDPNVIKDIDGNVYHTDTICGKIWMLENLKTTRYRNGDPIAMITSNSQWGNLITSAYCDYDNVSSNGLSFGRLYNWYAVNDSRNICPEGWHVPTLYEFLDLVNCYGGDSNAGKALKETGTAHWNDPNVADNLSGFTALGSGYRNQFGEFASFGVFSLFWNSSNFNDEGAYAARLNNSNAEVLRGVFLKTGGFVVRCVKD